MAGTNIADGSQEAHDSGVQPLQDTGPGITPLAAPTATSPSGPAQGGVMPTTAMNLEQQAQDTADCAAAMHAGMDARDAILAHYEAGIMPLGGSPYQMPVPEVPDAATPPAMSDLYPWPGQEPTPASAGLGAYPNTGNVPA